MFVRIKYILLSHLINEFLPLCTMSGLKLSAYKMDVGLYIKYLMSSNLYDSSSPLSFTVLGKLTWIRFSFFKECTF